MTRTAIVSALFPFLLLSTPATVALGAIVQIGELNVIDDPGNASDGLRYLDMTFSDGLGLAGALANAQASYPDARVATPAEFDDLFAAAGINYNGTTTASGGFAVGAGITISNLSNYDGGALRAALRTTDNFGLSTSIWTVPDLSSDSASTRDYLILTRSSAGVRNFATSPPNPSIGWLLVSEAAPVPEPAAFSIAAAAVALLFGFGRLRRRRG